MIHIAIRPVPYGPDRHDTRVRVPTICGDMVPPWHVVPEGADPNPGKLCHGCKAAIIDRFLSAPVVHAAGVSVVHGEAYALCGNASWDDAIRPAAGESWSRVTCERCIELKWPRS